MRLRVGYARYLSLNGAGSSKPSRAAIDREAGAIVRRARAAAGLAPEHVNLTSTYSVTRYIARADEIAARLAPRSSLLEWGCGSGLLSYLLARRGLRVTANDRAPSTWTIAHDAGISPCISPGNAPLPFSASAFDAIASTGVLEHVADQRERLGELRRVLKPGGLLFIYMYPNSTGWVEFLFDRLHPLPVQIDDEGGTVGHQKRLSLERLTAFVAGLGFEIVAARREDLLPLTGRTLPPAMRRRILDRWQELALLEGGLRRIPLLERLSSNLTVIARRPVE